MSKKGSEARLEQERHKKELRENLVTQLAAATKEQENKLDQSVAHLRAQLVGARDKYLTVNGYMQARTTYEQVLFGDEQGKDDAPLFASDLAVEMSDLAGSLAKKLDETDVADLDETFLDGLLEEDFVKLARFSPSDVTRQLLIVNLLQNVGPSIDDIVAFREGTKEGIARLEEELANLDKPASELTSV